MHGKVFLEVSSKHMVYREVHSKNFIYNNGEINKKIFSIRDVKVNLKNKKLIILTQGEEVYVMPMKLPRVSRKNIFEIIEGELEDKFKKINDIMFSYEIIRRCRYSLEVMVFCMNYGNRKLIEECHHAGFRIAGIVPVQFYVWENYKNRIKIENYIFVLKRNEFLYFMAGHKGKMVFNNVFKNPEENDFFNILEQFQVKLSILMKDFEFSHIFFVNFPYKGIIEKLSQKYMCKDLGKFILK